MFQYCIIGGGPAGLVLADSLRKHVSPEKIVILEAGGVTDQNEKASEFVSVGDTNYKPIRSFLLGGHGHLWGGACPRLNPDDFRMRSLFGLYEDWPISYHDLEGYYDRAEELLNVKKDLTAIMGERIKDPVINSLLGSNYHGTLPYGNRRYFVDTLLPDLQQSGVLIRTDCVVRSLFENDKEVTVAYHDTQLDATMQLSTSCLVLCSGGLSNARLLQLSKSSQFPNGIGNHSGLLGANHMDHPRVSVKIERSVSAHMQDNGLDGRLPLSMIKPVDAVRPELAFASITIDRETTVVVDKDNLKEALRKLSNSGELQDHLKDSLNLIDRVSFDFEVMDPPNKINRLELSQQLDSYGDPMLATNINIDAERSAVNAALLSLLSEVFKSSGYRVSSLSVSGWTGQHPSGSTRMATKPEDGVVDANLKVFHTNAIYVLGSSVFPTVGYANPTLTIVSLSLRLADHLIALRAR